MGDGLTKLHSEITTATTVTDSISPSISKNESNNHQTSSPSNVQKGAPRSPTCAAKFEKSDPAPNDNEANIKLSQIIRTDSKDDENIQKFTALIEIKEDDKLSREQLKLTRQNSKLEE